MSSRIHSTPDIDWARPILARILNDLRGLAADNRWQRGDPERERIEDTVHSLRRVIVAVDHRMARKARNDRLRPEDLGQELVVDRGAAEARG